MPINALILALGIVAAVSGCARAARDLPPDYGSVDSQQRIPIEDFDPATASWTCVDIRNELTALDTAIASQDDIISGKRVHNQGVVMVGTFFFLPALLALDNDNEAKQKIDDINLARDKLLMLQELNDCPS